MTLPEPVEGTFQVPGVELYSKTWPTEEPAKAILVFFHGYSDHCNSSYDKLFDSLRTRGIAVYSFDQRGWGRSTKKDTSQYGLTGPTSTVLADMKLFINSVLEKAGATPVFVMGISMGGGQILTFAGTPEFEDVTGKIQGWIAECPLVGFPPEFTPNSIEVFAGRLAAKILPRFQLRKPVVAASLTRDKNSQDRVLDDEYAPQTGTLEGLSGMLERTANLNKGVCKLNSNVKALIILHGSGDKVTSHVASRKYFDEQTLTDKTYKEYDGGYHMLHADLCADEFIKDVGDWIEERF